MTEAIAPHARWARPRITRDDLVFDAVLAGVLVVAATLTSLLYHRTGIYEEPAPVWLWVLGLGLCTVPLAARRVWPVPVAVVVSVGFFVCGQFAVPELLIINICLFLALYTVGAWESRRQLAHWSQIIIALAMVAWLVTTLIIASSDTDAFPGVSRSGIFSAYATYAVIQIITNLLYFGGAFWFGERTWRAARVQAQLAAQGRELDLERRTSAAQAVALDRVAIARELHDVVAHHVSVMGIQAAAARRTLERDPARATASLEIIEESAHATVTELRQLVHTLREPDAGGDGAARASAFGHSAASEASTVGLSQLGTLVAASQTAGTSTTLIVTGDPRPLPMLIDIALYRVVQESLTNVRKHAGRGAAAEVRLRFMREGVEVEIVDDGTRSTMTAPRVDQPAPDVAAGTGLGLQGMRERVGAVGGTVEARRRESRGFLVRAHVPLPPVVVEAADRASGGAA